MFLFFPGFFAAVLLLAVLLDALLGEPRHRHPLVGFGKLATAVENRLWQEGGGVSSRLRGTFALVVMLGGAEGATLLLQWLLWSRPWVFAPVCVVVVYLCIAARSLREHAEAVAGPLSGGDIVTAREQLARIVSRDTDQLTETEVASAVCESVLENGSDGIFAALFWFLVAGLPGVVLYRAANTLDAMWGYRSQRYRDFGWAAARFDDVLNWLPARLVAFSYALMGNFSTGISCWRRQAPQWKSPNAGPVMAAGAGALRITLGGPAPYHGERQSRPQLGCGDAADVDAIAKTLALVHRTLVFWVAAVFIFALIAKG